MTLAPLEQPLPAGELLVLGDAPGVSSLPMKEIRVTGHVTGALGSICMAQRFGNPFDRPIEVLYRFAIPHEAAVSELELRIGKRIVRGAIEELGEASRLYQEGVRAGHRSVLATEERPNLYTVLLGNVAPGETVEAIYRYSLTVRFEDDGFELVIPFAITPRYVRPGTDRARAAATAVAYAQPGSPLPRLEIDLSLDPGVPIADPASPSHSIEVTRLDGRRCDVRLPDPAAPVKDFVLRYRVADGNGVASWGLTTAGGDGVFTYLLLVPPRPEQPAPAAREYVFVLDRSGSMSGHPIMQARNALRAALRMLNPGDTFRLLLFDDRREWFHAAKQTLFHYSDAAVARADRFLSTVDGRGGTELIPALEEVFALPPDAGRPRIVLLFTDGAIEAETAAAKRVRARAASVRLFCLGIGPSVNRYLLDELAAAGRGTAQTVGLDEDIEDAIIRLQDSLAFPVLTDLRLEGAAGAQVYPDPLPDLYAGQALEIVIGHPTHSPPAGEPFTLRGRRGSDEITLTVHPVQAVQYEPLISRRWAQRRLNALLAHPDRFGVRDRIVRLSKRYCIITPLTALVAVDREAAVQGQRTQVVVSSPLPEGLSPHVALGAFAAPGELDLPFLLSSGTAGGEPPAPMTVREDVTLFQQMAGATGLGGWTAQPPEPPMDSGGADEVITRHDPAPPSMGLTPEERLRALLRGQRADGSWGSGAPAIEEAAAALAAFARARQTPGRGSFRNALRKALDWLSRAAVSRQDGLLVAWVRAEILASEDRTGEVPRAPEPQAITAAGSIGPAVAYRVAVLRGEQPAALPPGVLQDPRAAIIAGVPVDEALVNTLSEAWRACAAAVEP